MFCNNSPNCRSTLCEQQRRVLNRQCERFSALASRYGVNAISLVSSCRGAAGETNSARSRWPRPTPLVQGVKIAQHDGGNLCLLASAAIRLASTQIPRRRPTPPRYIGSPPSRRRAGTHRCRETDRAGFSRRWSGPAPPRPGRACRTTDRPDRDAPLHIAAAASRRRAERLTRIRIVSSGSIEGRPVVL